jgi:hypothetical protein
MVAATATLGVEFGNPHDCGRFDLRCYVRENLLKFINTHMPDNLPQRRYRGIEKEKI